MKMSSKLGDMEIEKDGDKYTVAIPPESNLAQIFEKFEATDWVKLLEKCKESGMEADEIMTATNKEGTEVILSSANKTSLSNLLNYISEVAGVTIPTAKKEPTEKFSVKIDAEMAKSASQRLGI